MPAWMQQQYQTAMGSTNAAAARPASAAVAGLNPQQQQAFGNAQANYGQGMAGMQGVQGNAGQIANGGINPASIAQFQNPYTAQVVNTTNQQMALQEAQQGAAINGQANQQGAFGGDRSAIAQGMNNQNWTNAMAQTDASLNNQGFNTAAGLATNSAGLKLQGNSQLQNAIMGQQQLQMQQNQNLLSSGNQQQQQAQNVANWPIQSAQLQASILNPGVGGTVQSSGQYGNYMSPVQGGLIGMNLGNQIGNYFGNQSSADLSNYANAVNTQAVNWLDTQSQPTSGYGIQP